MNRTIKLRAWIPAETLAKLPTRLLPSLRKRGDISKGLITEISQINFDSKILYIDDDFDGEWIDIADCVIQQFTGLLDKNGEEIYEGDVLQTRKGKNKAIWIVKWNNQKAEFCLAFPNTQSLGQRFACWEKVELKVIGNIFSNPELLEK